MTTSVRNPAITLSMGLMKSRTCTTSIEIAQMMVPLISKQFTMTVEVSGTALHVLRPHGHSQRRIYVLYAKLYGLSATINNCYSQIKYEPHLHSHHSSAIEDSKLNLSLQEEKLYLSPGIGYRALTTWFTKYNSMSTENLNKSSQIVISTVKNTETRIPTFKVPIFRGDTLDGDEYIRMVKMTFRSNAMS